MGIFGNNTSSSTNSAQPYGPAQEGIDWAIGQITQQGQNGQLVRPNTTSTVVPYAQQTMTGMQGVEANANVWNANNPMGGVLSSANSIYGNGGYNQYQQTAMNALSPFSQGAGNVSTGGLDAYGNAAMNNPAMQGMAGIGSGQLDVSSGAQSAVASRAGANPFMGTFQNIANGGGNVSSGGLDRLSGAAQANPFLSGFQNFAGGAGNVSNQALLDYARGAGGSNPAMAGFQELSGARGPSVSEQNLMRIAQGGMLGLDDPNFEAVLARATQRQNDAVNMQASAMGRYGSGAHQGVLAREIGDMQAQARMEQLMRERQAQVEANTLIDQQRYLGDQTRLSALGGMSNASESAASRQLAALQAATGVDIGNRDAQMQALMGGANTYATGIGQGISAASGAAGIQAGNRDARLNAASSGSAARSNDLNTALNAVNSASTIQGANRDSRLSGLTALGTTYGSGVTTGLNAATSAATVQGQNADRTINASNNLFNAGQQGVTNMGQAPAAYTNIYDAQNLGNNSLMDVGAMNEDLYSRYLTDQLRIQQESQQAPYANAQGVLTALNGGTSPYAQNTQTAQGPSSGLSNIAGGLLAGASLLGPGGFGLFG